MNHTPLVRVVVVNFNGGELIARCIGHLLATEWPSSRLEIVVVDNASTDHSADAIDGIAPNVRVLRSRDNLGFAGGCNLGLQDLHDVDFVALVNNDAFVSPDWLAPLVNALDADPSIGAANAKLVFDHRYVAVRIETEGFTVAGDPRVLGLRVSGVRVEGDDAMPGTVFEAGFFGEERGSGDEARFCWSGPIADLWVPVKPDQALPCRAQVRLASVAARTARLGASGSSSTAEITSTPVWHDVELSPPAFDVINNAGNVLVDDAYSADRGFLEQDCGQYEERSEVFAWCGAAVLLKREYLADVGLFDQRYFLYYEDTDLAWRGRLRGWRYVYVPESVVRHLHAASSVEGSRLYDHYLERNRLLTLAKHAPAGVVITQILGYLRETWSLLMRQVVVPRLRRRGSHGEVVRRRTRSFFDFLRYLPTALWARWSPGRKRVVRRRSLLAWSVPRESGRWAVTRGRS